MISELELKIIEEKLNTNEYIVVGKDFIPKNGDKIFKWIKNLFFIICIIILSAIFNINSGSDNSFVFYIILLSVFLIGTLILVRWYFLNCAADDFVVRAKTLKKKIDEHNKNVYDNLLKSELMANEIDNLTKEISIYHWDFAQEEVLGVNNDNKYLAYYKLGFNSSTSKFYGIIQKVDYNNIIKYELIDNSTTSQTATSITSSNAGKAFGGAIATGLLLDDATTGAIIGSSGQRKTETTFKTTVKNSYQIVIYLNSLENSTITINTTYRNKVNEIVSILEYILRNQNNQ